MGRTATLALALVVALGAVHGRAFADPDGDAPAVDEPIKKDPAVAKKWFSAAQLLEKKGDAATKKANADAAKQEYDNAIVAYGKALDAGEDAPNIAVRLALASLQDKTGAIVDAIKNYKLVVAAKGVTPAMTKQANAKLDAATMKVGLVTLVVQPDGAEISLDGNVIGKAPLPEPLVLMPGKYKVGLLADGYVSKDDVELSVEAGEESQRKLDMVKRPPESSVKHEVAYVAPPPAVVAKPSKLPIYVGGGVAVAALGTGIVLGSLALRWHGVLTNPDSKPNARLDAQQFGRQEAHGADAAFGLTIAAAAFTSYWYFVKYKHPHAAAATEDSTSPTAPKLVLAPWVQPDVGGLAAVGQF
jgi:hypothetical protein